MNTLFVYGTLRREESNCCFLKKSEFIGIDYVKGFIMLDFGDYPMIFKSGNEDVITVEIYKIDDYTLHQIDIFEEYSGIYDDNNLYFREAVKNISGVTGFIYTGNAKKKFTGGQLVESGDWTKRSQI